MDGFSPSAVGDFSPEDIDENTEASSFYETPQSWQVLACFATVSGRIIYDAAF